MADLARVRPGEVWVDTKTNGRHHVVILADGGRLLLIEDEWKVDMSAGSDPEDWPYGPWQLASVPSKPSQS